MRLIFFLLCFPLIYKGQIDIEGIVEPVTIGNFKKDKSDVDLSYFPEGKDTVIHITYKNENYSTDYKSLRFRGGLKDIEELYKLCYTTLTSNDKKELRLKLGDTPVSLSRNTNALWFWTDAGYFTIKKEKDLKQLFGKRE